MGVEYNQPAHLLDRYIKGGDINGGRLYAVHPPFITSVILMEQRIGYSQWTDITGDACCLCSAVAAIET